MNTLKYLHKEGRLSSSSYVIGTVADVKPVIHLSNRGQVEIPAKLLGVRRGLRYLAQACSEYKVGTAYSLYIMYTRGRENGVHLAAA